MSERESGADSGTPDGGGEGARSEWITAVVSAVLVAGVIAVLLYEALTASNSPPRITAAVDTILQTETGYLVRFRAHNLGEHTAGALLLEGELTDGGRSVEKSEATLNFVPGNSTRIGGLFFSEDPRRYTLQIRPKGYERP